MKKEQMQRLSTAAAIRPALWVLPALTPVTGGHCGRHGWTVVSVGNQIMSSGHGGCRCLKVKVFCAEAEPREDSTERRHRVCGSLEEGAPWTRGHRREISQGREGLHKKCWHWLPLLQLVYPMEMEFYPSKKNSLGSLSKTFRRQANASKNRQTGLRPLKTLLCVKGHNEQSEKAATDGRKYVQTVYLRGLTSRVYEALLNLTTMTIKIDLKTGKIPE